MRYTIILLGSLVLNGCAVVPALTAGAAGGWLAVDATQETPTKKQRVQPAPRSGKIIRTQDSFGCYPGEGVTEADCEKATAQWQRERQARKAVASQPKPKAKPSVGLPSPGQWSRQEIPVAPAQAPARDPWAVADE